jgi:hypothetical protein
MAGGQLTGGFTEPEELVEVKLKNWPKYWWFLNKNFFILNIIQIFTFYCR